MSGSGRSQGPAGEGFTQDPRRILGRVKKGRFGPRVGWTGEVPTPGLGSFSQTRSEFCAKSQILRWDSLRVCVTRALAFARARFDLDPVLN